VESPSEVKRFGEAMLIDTPLCDFGFKAPSFELISHEKKSYSRDGLAGSKGLLIAFICNHCPYVKAIIANFVSDAQKLQTIGIQTAAIMPNNYISHPADSPEKMSEFVTQHNFGFPYLIDETQSVAKAYGAVCTPDFFGFNANLELQYRGRLDNLTMGKDGTRRPELFDAMNVIANTGSGPESQIASMGCSIKWK
jgi:peroxiredoxin